LHDISHVAAAIIATVIILLWLRQRRTRSAAY
jgi:hypothetical protein